MEKENKNFSSVAILQELLEVKLINSTLMQQNILMCNDILNNIESLQKRDILNNVGLYQEKCEYELKKSIIEYKNLELEMKKIQNKLKAQKKIIQNCERMKMESDGKRISRRDYMFGIVQRLFGLFLPAIYAIYGTIMFNFLLSVSNAASDLSVFWWLYYNNHPNQAYIILGIDYFPGILTLAHHLTESLNNQVPAITLMLECFLVGVLYPMAVPISYAIFIMARIRGEAVIEERLHYLASMTTVIRTCFEDPFQLLFGIRLFSTQIIPVPWNSRATFCDTLGNCLDLGSAAAIISFLLTFFSMVKGTMDGCQSDDYFGYGVSIFINITFRIVTFSIICIYLREWILVLLVILLIINISVNVKFRDKRSGINLVSSSFCSIFQPVVIPENPEIKHLTGATTLDMKIGRKISFWISIIHLPFIFLAGIGTYFITTRLDGFKQDFNIAFTTEQLEYFTIYIQIPLFLLALISTIVFHHEGRKWFLIFINMLLLLGTAVVFSLPAVFMPPSPQSLVLVTHKNIWGGTGGRLEIAQGLTFSKSFLNIPDSGLIFACTLKNCRNIEQDWDKTAKIGNLTLNIKDTSHRHADEDREGSIYSPGFLANNQEIYVFHPSSNHLQKQLQLAECISCQNMTNACQYIIQGRRRCTRRTCSTFPVAGKIHGPYLKKETPQVEKIKNDRCSVNEYLNSKHYEQEVPNFPYYEGQKLDVQASCNVPFPYPAEHSLPSCEGNVCSFAATAECLGNMWGIDAKCEKCSSLKYCENLRRNNPQLGPYCSDQTGKCICLQDEHCKSNQRQDADRVNDAVDCTFPGVCKIPSCSVTFNGKKGMIVHELNETIIQIDLPHESCSIAGQRIVMAVMGGGGGSCGCDGCSGGSSGYLAFRKFGTSFLDQEQFNLSINIGDGGNENGTSSTVIGPTWFPTIEAKGGKSGKFCDNLHCILNVNHADTFHEWGSFAPGNTATNHLGKKLKLDFPNSGPLLRPVNGAKGKQCTGGRYRGCLNSRAKPSKSVPNLEDTSGSGTNLEIGTLLGEAVPNIENSSGECCRDHYTCLGMGGAGGGLSIGSVRRRKFSQPVSGFGSGGANGSPGQRGVFVIWSEPGLGIPPYNLRDLVKVSGHQEFP